MTNQDRGLDNWMIKICWHNHTDGDEHAHLTGTSESDIPTVTVNGKATQFPRDKAVVDQPLASPALVDLRTSETLSASRTGSPRPGTPNRGTPHIHIGAIDNSLAFPWKHPDEWRSFPLYGFQPNFSNC